MLFRLSIKTAAAGALLLALWVVGSVRDSSLGVHIRPVGAPRGPVRILRFYATVGTLVAGEKAQLCYGVENAKTVQIAPGVPAVSPAASRCLDILPRRTTHYSILAEGFDGQVAVRFFTLMVSNPPVRPSGTFSVAELLPPLR